MEQKYVWNIKPKMTHSQFILLSRFGQLLAKLLFTRNITTEKEGMSMLKDFGLKYDPFVMKNMDKAVSKIRKAIKNGTKITVYGDYDADGVTASAILIKAIRALGGTVESYIPDRFSEGYGINCDALKKISENGTGLVITVDCGIRSVEEAKYAKEIKLPLIITDHHEPGEEIPQPMLLVSPKQPGDEYPDKNLAGCGIALKIAEALSKDDEEKKIDLDELLMIASIGTVADLVPLINENRSLVRKGLSLFGKKKCLFLEAMAETAGFDYHEMTGNTISFAIAPRLNAAGRIKSAGLALDLLLAEDSAEAKKYAREIEELNKKRKELTQAVQEAAERSIVDEGVPSVICLKDETYDMGIVGLAAARLVEKYYRPAFVGFTDGSNIRMSGRSIREFNMIEAMDSISDVFEKYGGHAMAAGATVSEEKWNDFVNRIRSAAEESVSFERLKPSIDAEMILPANLINLRLYETIAMLEPFGEGNRQPRFEVDHLKIVSYNFFGTDKVHLKLNLEGDGKQQIQGIIFFGAHLLPELTKYIDVICTIEKNSWNGNDSVQIKIEDVRTSKIA